MTADRADEIAREIVRTATTKVTEDVCVLGHDRSALIEAIAAALRAYGDELLGEVENFIVEAAMAPQIRRDLRKRIRSLKSTPPTETQERT